MKDIIVGIDPDIVASGIAILNPKTDEITLQCLDFVGVLLLLDDLAQRAKRGVGIRIYIEYSAATKHNWHLAHYSEKKSVASAKGYNLGQNHQIEQCIYDYAYNYHGLDIVRQPPFKKCWKGPDRKITHEELAAMLPIKEKATNQEKRDAALLAWLGAGKPLKLSVK